MSCARLPALKEAVDFSTLFISDAECVIYTTEGFDLLEKVLESFPNKDGASMTLDVGEDAAVLREKKELIKLQNQTMELQNRKMELILSLDIPDTEKAELIKTMHDILEFGFSDNCRAP